MKRWMIVVVCVLTGLSVWADDAERQRRYDQFFLEAMVQRQKGNHDAAFDLLSHCREIDPAASETYFFLAQYYAGLKDGERALDYYKQAASLSPDNATYMETLANAYIGQNQYAEAAEVLERLYQTNKDRQDLLETLFQLYRAQEQYDKAISVLDRLEVADGKTERLALQKSQLYLQMDNKKAAVEELKALADEHPNDLNYLRQYADMLRNDDRNDEAFVIYQRILAEEPNNSMTQMSLRSYFLTQGDSLAADSLTRHILLNKDTELDQKVFLLRREIAQSEQEGGDSTRVLALFHEMLEQPQETDDIAALCAAYMDLKKMPADSVAQMLERVLEIAPDNASARLHLVSMAWDEGDDERIISLCQAARQYNPEEMAFYYYQGMAYYRQDDHDHALEAFQNGIGVITDESNPAIVSDFYAIMGDLLHQKGLEREAFEAYDSCLQWKPDNIGCLNNYAYYLSLQEQQLDKAEQMSFRTIKAEPENATYLDTYAWVLFKQQRYAEARIYIDQTLQYDTLGTVSSEVLSHAGDIYAQCGDIDQAISYWQQALEKDPKNKMLIRKIKRKKYIKQ